MSALFAYAKNAKGELGLSVVLSVVSILLGLVPFFCMYRVICLFAAGTAAKAAVISWCAWSLAAYAGKVLCFTLSTGISHHAAYNILEGLRLRLVERFLHAPLGEVQKHSIGEIKSILVDKIENIEPPLAHMIPEGAGHIVLPVVSFIALFAIDWRLALAALAVMLSMSMVGSLAKLEVFSENMRQVKATVESLEAFLEMPALPEPAQPAALQGTGVELKNVHFSYSADGPEVLHGIDLTLPQGYDTPAGEAGKRLSGGEKQRIALARAFLKNSNLYILDESTSNLDFATENLIFNMIYNELADRSMLIVAHRLSTVRDCDLILVMDHGKIVERGTHDELLAKEGKYYELWNMQQGIFRKKAEAPKPVAAAVVEEDDDGESMTY